MNKNLNKKWISRPWGKMIRFCKNAENVTVKVLYIAYNECISLQRHKKRDQFYFILDPITIVRMNKSGNKIFTEAQPGEEFYFHRGNVHRAINTKTYPFARYLEISFGNYDEKDIERIEDKYGRKM